MKSLKPLSLTLLAGTLFVIAWYFLPDLSPQPPKPKLTLGANPPQWEDESPELGPRDPFQYGLPGKKHQRRSGSAPQPSGLPNHSTTRPDDANPESAAGSTRAEKRPADERIVRESAKLDIPKTCLVDLPGVDFSEHRDSLKALRDQIRGAQRFQSTPPRFVSLPPTPSGPSNDSKPPYPFPNPDARTGKTESNPSEALRDSQFQLASFNPHLKSTSESNPNYRRAQANPHVDPHQEVFSKTAFPSATECKACHEQIYKEWSMSGHAYASISPMFHKFEQRINDLTNGTIGYFCMRCHAPVATTMEHRRDLPIWAGPTVFREGVTCVACHRVKQAHGQDNGERRMEPGDITEPVYGSSAGNGVEIAKKYRNHFKVKTDLDNKTPGRTIHRRAIQFDQISKSTFCVSCHQVAVEPGISLEVVWDQYRASPSWRNGTTCQDCHMGRVPGKDEGYSIGPAAIIDGKTVCAERKHSNHQFYGPGYSIAHPGIFPQNPDAYRWSVNQWLQFDWRAGWGSEAFEDALDEGRVHCQFPPVWSNVDDRMDAREIVDANLKLLKYKRDLRRQVMENGSKIEGPFFAKAPTAGRPLNFFYNVKNISTGHNMPSGSLGAQPQLWLNVVLIGPGGNRLWESGYLDSIGDLADHHSADVLAGRVPRDKQLFNLQTKFLITNVKGTDRESILPVPFENDQLPFIRPDTRPNTVMNHPPFIRMEGHSIPATGQRKAKYRIPAELMTQPGCYRLSVRMRSRAEPIYFMKDVKATPEMIQSMNEGILDIHAYSKTFIVQ